MFGTLKRIGVGLKHRLYPADVYFIEPHGTWILHTEIRNIQKGLGRHRLRAKIIAAAPPVVGRIIHHIDRNTLLGGGEPDPSNRIILTWFHGDPEDPDPVFVRLFERLREVEPACAKIATSCGITERHLLKAGIPAGKIAIVPISVDTGLFAPQDEGRRAALRKRLGVPKDAVCIGSFQKDGNGWEEGDEPKLVKGPDVLIDVLRHVSKRHKVHVLLSGPARGFVKKGLTKAGVAFTHVNVEDYRALPEYYSALDLYLITSRLEGGPKAFMEAWACGVPVVSTRVGMPADHIRHGENGMLCETEDVAALAGCVDELIGDRALAADIARRGIADVAQFDWRVVAGSYYEKLYRPLLSERQKR